MTESTSHTNLNGSNENDKEDARNAARLTQTTTKENGNSINEVALLGLYTRNDRPEETGILSLTLPAEDSEQNLKELSRSSTSVCGANPALIATIRDAAGNLDVFVGNGSPFHLESEEGYVTRLRMRNDGSMRRVGRANCGVAPSAVVAVENGLVVACAADGALWSFLTGESFRDCDAIQPERAYGIAPGVLSHLSHAIHLPLPLSLPVLAGTMTRTERAMVSCERFILCDENASVVSLVRRRGRDGRLSVATWLHVTEAGRPTKSAVDGTCLDVAHIATRQPASIMCVRITGATRWDDATNMSEVSRYRLSGDEAITDIQARGAFLFVSRNGATPGIWRFSVSEDDGSIIEGRQVFWPTRIVSPMCIAIGEANTVIGLQCGGIIVENTARFVGAGGGQEF